MFRKLFSYGGTLLLTGAAFLAMPGSGWAQHSGGGHSGGAHFSGSHFGGTHYSGSHFGGYHGGFYHNNYHYGDPHAYHYPHYGYPNYGYRYHSPYYGSYPYNTAPYGLSGSAYDSGYDGLYGEASSSLDDTSTYGIPLAQSDHTAHVTLSAPADAEIWFNGTKATTTGSVRNYDTPPLTPGSRYAYEIRSRWKENGHEVTQTQQVKFTAGSHVIVSFPVQSKAL